MPPGGRPAVAPELIPDSVGALAADLPSSIVRAAQEMYDRRLVVSTLGNVSARHDDGLIITPTRWPYSMLHVHDLVAIGPDGTRRAGTREPSNEWRVHHAIYRARPDVGAIVHTHSVWATAWSWSNSPLTLTTEERRYLALGEIRVADYADAGSQALAENVVEGLGGGRAVLMARHGVLAIGDHPMAALESAEVVEREAQLETIVTMLRPADARQAQIRPGDPVRHDERGAEVNR